METEELLSKLRRLRCQSDYPLRLFLATLGHGVRQIGEGGGAAAAVTPPPPRWPLAAAPSSRVHGCPRCGYRGCHPRYRRLRAG